jgi:D-proline reductase (dithiol) PrdB
VLPVDTPRRDILLSHSSIGFDRWDAQRDLNVMLPLDRMQEVVAAGEVGSLASTAYAFLGAQRQVDGIMSESVPEVARRLQAEGVDAVFLTGV